MSGDVQPRKRKDKKKKKDDLGIEEPRGTAAALGEGDIFMHSPHEHGTGGNWCAKVIFFSLLAVLVTLIGLIILENRGLSELEANSVESKYSGVLEGWLEDAHDDHHDEHTLDLNHHDDEDDDDHSGGLDHGDEVEHDDDDDDEEQNHEDEENDHDEDENEDDDDDDDEDKIDQEENNDEDSQEVNDDSQEAYDDGDQNEDSEEQNLETAEEDEIEERNYRRYYQSIENQANDDNDDDDDDDLQKIDDDDDNDDDQSVQNDDEDDQEDNDDSQENNDFEDEQDQIDNNDEDDNEDSIENDQNEAQENEDEDEHEEEDSDVEVEHIEKEVFDDDVSTEAPEPEEDKSEEVSDEANFPADEADEDDVEFLEPGDLDDLPDALPIPLPKGKPLAEMEDTTTETPQDTLADEEEYERQQEALRREKEQASQGMWLKLVVGGALLVATQAVLRRATGPREPEDEVDTTREETPLSDRRMTLIAEPVAPPVIPKPQEVSRPKEVVRQAPVVKSAPPPPPEDDEELEEEEEEIVVTKGVGSVGAEKDFVDRELYSDEEEAEDEEEEEIIEEKKEPPKPTASKPAAPIKEPPKPTGLKPAAPIKEPPKPTGLKPAAPIKEPPEPTALKPAAPIKEPPKPPVKETLKPIEKKETLKPAEKAPTPEEEYEDDDVEIIEDEDIGEEVEEEEDDISDVDDAELLTRLEAKYGRLPEPERPGRKMEGGNSVEDEWAGEPGDAFWRDELERAERDLRQGEWAAAAKRASAAALRSSARARYTAARALDAAAEAKRDNGLLTKAIAAYLELLKMNERLSDEKLMEVASRALDRIQFRGNYLGAEPIYRLLIRRFPDDPTHRNNLTVSFLMANRVDLAEEVIKETLSRWPSDRTALAHHGFILKTLHNRHEEAVKAFTKALEGDTGPANEPRFYYHLGDSLLLLGRFKEAHEVHKRGAKLGHFLSPAQRSLYNVDRLKSKPWWNVEQTPYNRLARALEKSWMEILKEGRAAQELYEMEKEGLKERGEWSQLDLFVRGREVPGRCSRAPVTCNIVRSEAAASGCRRGQVKFSSLGAGAHIRPHVGPTNCRLRMHLGLSNTKDTYIRVDQETRQWQTGKVLLFDDSFEHEVWHNGSGARLVLVVDVWHPDLTHNERRQLPAI